LLLRGGRVLFVHRNGSRAWAPNCWDAPGGHIERGESDLEALARELKEELGIELRAADTRLVARLEGADFDARVFLVGSWSGEPENKAPEEHDDMAWLDEDHLSGLVLADRELLPIVLAALHDVAGTGI
jgi:8-oxo-dGTP pyrophosphatase MutT (NUDIX family)